MWDHVILSVGRQIHETIYGQLMNSTLAAEAEVAYLNAQAFSRTMNQTI